MVLPKGIFNWLALQQKCFPPHSSSSPSILPVLLSDFSRPRSLHFLLLNLIGVFAGRLVVGRPQGVAKLSLNTLDRAQKMLGEQPARRDREGGHDRCAWSSE